MPVHFDTSQLDRLAADLNDAPKRLQFKARGVMKKGALEILRNMRREFGGHNFSRSVPRSLEMEPRGTFGWEIGELDSAGKQWGIAAILAYGTANNAPVADHRKALRREVPEIMRHLGAEAEAAVFGKVAYTTKAGVTRWATQAQVDNWTRGSRA